MFWRIDMTLIICLHRFVGPSEAVVTSWTEWPGFGYVGLSTDGLSHSDSAVECQKDGGSMLVYEPSDELDAIIKGFSNMYTAWISGHTSLNDCNYISVLNSVTPGQSTCDDIKQYLCYLAPPKAAATTASVTTTQLTTTPQTTTAELTTTTTTITTTLADSELTTEELLESISRPMITNQDVTLTTDRGTAKSTISRETVDRLSTTGMTTEFDTITHKDVTWITGYTTSMDTIGTRVMNDLPGLEWNVWIPWTECTMTCNTGTRFRLKLCASDDQYWADCNQTLGSLNNITISYATQWDSSCNSHPCPLWTYWSAWSDCSASCDHGTIRRHRICLNEEPGKYECPGDSYEMDFCDMDKCPAYVPRDPDDEQLFKESDSRPSAIGLGSMSVIFVLIELILILIIDLATISKQLRYLKRNLSHLRCR